MDFHSCLSKSSNWKEPAAIPALCWRVRSNHTEIEPAQECLSWGFGEHPSVQLLVNPALATSFEGALGRPAASLSVCLSLSLDKVQAPFPASSWGSHGSGISPLCPSPAYLTVYGPAPPKQPRSSPPLPHAGLLREPGGFVSSCPVPLSRRGRRWELFRAVGRSARAQLGKRTGWRRRRGEGRLTRRDKHLIVLLVLQRRRGRELQSRLRDVELGHGLGRRRLWVGGSAALCGQGLPPLGGLRPGRRRGHHGPRVAAVFGRRSPRHLGREGPVQQPGFPPPHHLFRGSLGGSVLDSIQRLCLSASAALRGNGLSFGRVLSRSLAVTCALQL